MSVLKAILTKGLLGFGGACLGCAESDKVVSRREMKVILNDAMITPLDTG
jgi:hypothetical protein